jgi:hypothetical protein
MLYIIWGSKGDKWKMVCSLSETMSTMCLTPWEAMKSRFGSCRVWETHGKIPGAQIRLAGPTFPGAVVRIFRFFILFITMIFVFYSLKQIEWYIYVVYFVREEWKYAFSLSETTSATQRRMWEATLRGCRGCWHVWEGSGSRTARNWTCGNRPLNSEAGDCRVMLGTVGPRHPSGFTGAID